MDSVDTSKPVIISKKTKGTTASQEHQSNNIIVSLVCVLIFDPLPYPSFSSRRDIIGEMGSNNSRNFYGNVGEQKGGEDHDTTKTTTTSPPACSSSASATAGNSKDDAAPGATTSFIGEYDEGGNEGCSSHFNDEDCIDNNTNTARKKRRKVLKEEEEEEESIITSTDDLEPQLQPQQFLDNDSLSIVLTKFSNVLDLHKWKSVSKGFDKLCTKAIEDKCPKDQRKTFETRKELRDAIMTFYNIKYQPIRRYEGDEPIRHYLGGESRRRMDAEEIACIYGWIMNGWLTSKIIDFSYLFQFKYKFNEDIGSWDVSNAKTMSFMFQYAHSFNQDISSWDTSRVTNMQWMFSCARSFNQDISSWDTSKVTNTRSMFDSAYSFNRDISSWDTSKVTDTRGMFHGSGVVNARQLPWFREDMMQDI